MLHAGELREGKREREKAKGNRRERERETENEGSSRVESFAHYGLADQYFPETP